MKINTIEKKYFSLTNLLLVLILLVSIFFRFYNTPARYGFDFDPTRDALIILYGAKTFSFPLVGAASGIAPITFGPWYYYQMIIWQIIFPFYYSAWYLVGISSVLVSLFLYKIGELLENKWFGLLLAFLAAVSPSETGQTQGLSNPDLIPLYSVIVIWLFVKLYLAKEPSVWWFFLWGFVLSIGINIHYQMLGLIVLPIIFFVIVNKNILKRLLAFITGFLPPWIPLIVFNFLSHGQTLKGIEYFAIHHPYVPNGWKLYLFHFWLPFWSYIFGINYIGGIIILLFVSVILLIIIFKRKIKHIYMYLLLTFAINFLVLRYVIAQRDYYYYLYLHSFIFIFFAIALWKMKNIKFGFVITGLVLIILSFFMIRQDIIPLRSRVDQLTMRTIAFNFMHQYPDKKIAVYACGKGGQNYAQGIEFFLLQANRLSLTGSGARLGMADFNCPLKITATIININLTHTSRSDIQNQGWKLITPEIVYSDTLEGWRK